MLDMLPRVQLQLLMHHLLCTLSMCLLLLMFQPFIPPISAPAMAISKARSMDHRPNGPIARQCLLKRFLWQTCTWMRERNWHQGNNAYSKKQWVMLSTLWNCFHNWKHCRAHHFLFQSAASRGLDRWPQINRAHGPHEETTCNGTIEGSGNSTAN